MNVVFCSNDMKDNTHINSVRWKAFKRADIYTMRSNDRFSTLLYKCVYTTKFLFKLHYISLSIYPFVLCKIIFHLRIMEKIHYDILFIFYYSYNIELNRTVQWVMISTIFMKLLAGTSNTKTFCSQKTTDYMSTYIPIYISVKRNL